MPTEYCEYSGVTEQCLEWLQANLPEEFTKLDLTNIQKTVEAEKKHQKRGGKGSKGIVTDKTGKGDKKKNVVAKVTLQRAPRGKNKYVTVIKGLATFDVDLKAASKMFSGRFACGSSVTAPDEIVVQGDVKDELIELIASKWPQIAESQIEDLGDQKR